MKLLNTLAALVVAGSIVTAAPALPAELDERGFPILIPQLKVWIITGYGNPNCEGEVVWFEMGIDHECKNVPTLAASYGWTSMHGLEVQTWMEADVCAMTPVPIGPNPTTTYVGPDSHGGKYMGCVNTPAHGFHVRFYE